MKLIHITEDQLLFSNLCLQLFEHQLTTERIFYEDRQIKRGLLIGFVLCNEENEIRSYFVNWLEESTGAKLTCNWQPGIGKLIEQSRTCRKGLPLGVSWCACLFFICKQRNSGCHNSEIPLLTAFLKLFFSLSNTNGGKLQFVKQLFIKKTDLFAICYNWELV